MNSKLDYDIKDKYSIEIDKIIKKFDQLENGRVYNEITNVRSDGYWTTNVRQLKNLIADLLIKIQTGAESEEEKMSKYF